MSDVTIRSVGIDDVLEVRAAVLRPGKPTDAARFPGDEDPRSLHLAASGADGSTIGVVTVVLEAPGPAAADVLAGTLDPEGRAWRLRGMAVVESAQRRGIGRMLVSEALERLTAEERGPRGMFLHARAWVLGFYERLGFTGVGASFEVPGVGPHVMMVMRFDGANEPR